MAKQPAPTSSGRRVSRAGKNSTQTERMQISLRKRLLNRAVLIYGSIFVGTLLIIFAGLTLYYKVYADPQRVFWDMIGNNLRTASVTKQSIHQNGTAVNNETIQMSFSPTVIVHDVKKVSGNAGNNKIELDSIGTPTADYQHYTLVEQPAAKGKKLNYSSIYKLWLKNGGGEAKPQLINSAVFGAVLFGDLNNSQHAAVMAQLKNAYHVNFGNVKKHSIGSRRVYTYQAVVPLKEYAQAARNYAAIEGLSAANQISSDNYSSNAQLKVKITVDVLSRQLKTIEYTQQSVTENYSGYGILADIRPPAKTVDAQTFQKAINALRQQ